VLALILGVLYALTAREAACVRQAIAQQAEARAATRVTGAKKLDLPRSADYWWAFAGCLGIVLGLGLWQGYQFYILSDYIKLGQTNPDLPIATAVVILSGIFTASLVVCMAFGGWISDKVGRVKPFVFGASLGFALPIVLMLLVPSWPTIVVAQVMNGLTFGLYLAVDQALMTFDGKLLNFLYDIIDIDVLLSRTIVHRAIYLLS